MEEREQQNEDEQAPAGEDAEGPDASELDEDPAYNPDDEGLKQIKGG